MFHSYFQRKNDKVLTFFHIINLISAVVRRRSEKMLKVILKIV